MADTEKVGKIVYLEKKQLDQLKVLAKFHNTSESAIVRQALKQYTDIYITFSTATAERTLDI